MGIIFLGAIVLIIFSFVAVIVGFIIGMIAFLATGRKSYEIWKSWWIVATSIIVVLGAIYLITMF